MKEWKRFTDDGVPIMVALNRHWDTPGHPKSWSLLWKTLWSSWGLPYSCLILQQVLHHGYFTNHQDAIWGVTLDIYFACKLLGESIKHIFFECEKVKLRWNILDACLCHTPLLSLLQDNLLLTFKKAMNRQCQCPAQLILLTKVLHTIWVKRNQISRQGNHFRFPLEHIVWNVLLQVEALRDITRLPTKTYFGLLL